MCPLELTIFKRSECIVKNITIAKFVVIVVRVSHMCRTCIVPFQMLCLQSSKMLLIKKNLRKSPNVIPGLKHPYVSAVEEFFYFPYLKLDCTKINNRLVLKF